MEFGVRCCGTSLLTLCIHSLALNFPSMYSILPSIFISTFLTNLKSSQHPLTVTLMISCVNKAHLCLLLTCYLLLWLLYIFGSRKRLINKEIMNTFSLVTIMPLMSGLSHPLQSCVLQPEELLCASFC